MQHQKFHSPDNCKLTVCMLMCYQYVYPDMHSSNWLKNGSTYKIFNVESA